MDLVNNAYKCYSKDLILKILISQVESQIESHVLNNIEDKKISLLDSSEKNDDSRSKNGSIEKKRLNYLVNLYNKYLAEDVSKLENLFSQIDVDVSTIKSFSEAGGMSKHYDIIINYKDGSTKTIEHKGITMKKKTPVNDIERPWKFTPQVLNQTNKFSKTSIYSNSWYTKAMPELKERWPDLPEIPTYSEWIKYDASPGRPKTDWGKALKIKRQSSKDNKKIIDDICKKYLKEFWTNISCDMELKECLRLDILNKFKEVMDTKNYWLNAFYKTSKDIVPELSFISITPKISNLNLEIDLGTSKKLPKAILTYNLTSNSSKIFTGEARLRWGNEKGIANIRWNIS